MSQYITFDLNGWHKKMRCGSKETLQLTYPECELMVARIDGLKNILSYSMLFINFFRTVVLCDLSGVPKLSLLGCLLSASLRRHYL